VVLIRFPGNAHQTLAATVVRLVEQQGEELLSAFVVVQPGYIRIRSRPSSEA
jgi:hypothetical protein